MRFCRKLQGSLYSSAGSLGLSPAARGGCSRAGIPPRNPCRIRFRSPRRRGSAGCTWRTRTRTRASWPWWAPGGRTRSARAPSRQLTGQPRQIGTGTDRRVHGFGQHSISFVRDYGMSALYFRVQTSSGSPPAWALGHDQRLHHDERAAGDHADHGHGRQVARSSGQWQKSLRTLGWKRCPHHETS